MPRGPSRLAGGFNLHPIGFNWMPIECNLRAIECHLDTIMRAKKPPLAPPPPHFPPLRSPRQILLRHHPRQGKPLIAHILRRC
jgi:hypothetical protein